MSRLGPRRRAGLALVPVLAMVASAVWWPGQWSALRLLLLQLLLAVAAAGLTLSGRHRSTSLAAVPEPPSRARMFVGREADLDAVADRHDSLRRERADSSVSGPVTLLLYGMPGVGKSALAHELNYRLRPAYPDGVVTVNVNDAGQPLATGTILAQMLRALDWRDELPGTTAERTRLFRAHTQDKRVLFLLDSVSDPAQLTGALPTARGCGVILTSRRNLGPQLGVWSYGVGPLEAVDAVEMLNAVTMSPDPFTDLADCVRLVEACGRLPVALRDAGEQVVYDDRRVADLLAPDGPAASTRRPHPGWAATVVDGIAAEFARLSPLERRAMCLLTLVESSSFASWVLRPLLQVPLATADVVATELANAQLLEAAGRDPRFDVARFRLHPVVRGFVAAQLDRDADLLAECHDALHRLRREYHRMARVAVDDGQAPLPVLDRLPLGAVPVRRGPEALAEWIRVEQAHLAEIAAEVGSSEPDLCWRLTTQFAEPAPGLPGAVDADAALAASFAAAAQVACHRFNALAELDVHVAEAGIRARAGDHAGAEALVTTVDARVRVLVRSRHTAAAARAARAHLVLAEVYAELPWPERAAAHLAAVDRTADDDPATVRRMRRVHRLLSPDDAPAGDPDPYWDGLADSVRCQQAGDWAGATRVLGRLRRQYDVDAYRRAVLHHRSAEAYFRQHQGNPSGGADTLLSAGCHAMLAVLAAERLRDRPGAARGHLMLSRVLALAGRPEQARRHSESARRLLGGTDALPPFTAHLPVGTAPRA